MIKIRRIYNPHSKKLFKIGRVSPLLLNVPSGVNRPHIKTPHYLKPHISPTFVLLNHGRLPQLPYISQRLISLNVFFLFFLRASLRKRIIIRNGSIPDLHHEAFACSPRATAASPIITKAHIHHSRLGSLTTKTTPTTTTSKIDMDGRDASPSKRCP